MARLAFLLIRAAHQRKTPTGFASLDWDLESSMIDLLLFLYVLLQEKWFSAEGDSKVQNVLKKDTSKIP